MLSVKVVYNDDCKADFGTLLSAVGNPMFEFINESNFKDLKKAWKYKNEASAKEVPFIGVYKDKELIKAFYKEDNSATQDNFYKWLNQYIDENAYKGYMEVTKLEGNNNLTIPTNSVHAGKTEAFMEGIGLQLLSPTNWFHTSVVTEIDWENHRFKTLNSIYKFTHDNTCSEC